MHKRIREVIEEYRSTKENVKNKFQECQEPVPYCKENVIEEDLGWSKEETKDKSVKILNGSGQVLIGKVRMWKKSGFQQKKTKEHQEIKKMKKGKPRTQKDREKKKKKGVQSKQGKERKWRVVCGGVWDSTCGGACEGTWKRMVSSACKDVPWKKRNKRSCLSILIIKKLNPGKSTKFNKGKIPNLVPQWNPSLLGVFADEVVILTAENMRIGGQGGGSEKGELQWESVQRPKGVE